MLVQRYPQLAQALKLRTKSFNGKCVGCENSF